ncbi:MAG: M91 family zinc metallopeptidase [Candidatus Bruticola sp.]
MSVGAVNNTVDKVAERVREAKVGSNFASLRHQQISSKLEGSAGHDNVKISERANALNTGFKADACSQERLAELEEDMAVEASSSESSSPFTLTDASAYEPGSDVAELAYKMLGERDRAQADISEILVLKASDKDNKINISSGQDGSIIVNVDGQEQKFSAAEARNLIIDGGDGDDIIYADDKVKNNLYVTGGYGCDNIQTAKGNDMVYDNYGANRISTKGGSDTVIANQLDYMPNEHSQTVKDERSFWQKIVDKFNGQTFQERTVDGNIIDGGVGDDYIEGGLGSDYINGGDGGDVIYGLNGSDYIEAGRGNDYVDSGRGDDTVKAAYGDNIVFGGRGDDNITVGKGDNVVAGGLGADAIQAGQGQNKITVDSADSVKAGSKSTVSTVESIDIPDNITINANAYYTDAPQTGHLGNSGFETRIQSDLDALASIETGQKMLQALAAQGHDVNIVGTDSGNYCSYWQTGMLNYDGSAGSGSSSTIAVDRSRIMISYDNWGKRPPIVGMYHEMAHAYDAGNGILDGRVFSYGGRQLASDSGEGVKAAELQAVGLGNVTNQVQMNPDGVSENDLRAALNLAQRDRY